MLYTFLNLIYACMHIYFAKGPNGLYLHAKGGKIFETIDLNYSTFQ